MALTEFTLVVHGNTRDEALREIDQVALDLLAIVGGDPWLSIDDDVTRTPIQQVQSMTQITDDMFIYVAKRRMMYGGPSKLGPQTAFREGFKPQKGEETSD